MTDIELRAPRVADLEFVVGAGLTHHFQLIGYIAGFPMHDLENMRKKDFTPYQNVYDKHFEQVNDINIMDEDDIYATYELTHPWDEAGKERIVIRQPLVKDELDLTGISNGIKRERIWLSRLINKDPDWVSNMHLADYQMITFALRFLD